MKSVLFLLRTLCHCSVLLLMFIVIGCAEKKPAPVGVSSGLSHPLDPLDAAEITSAKEILAAEKKLEPGFRFYVINLNEPVKAEVLAYKPGDAYRREAFAVLFDRKNNKTYEAIVDL